MCQEIFRDSGLPHKTFQGPICTSCKVSRHTRSSGQDIPNDEGSRTQGKIAEKRAEGSGECVGGLEPNGHTARALSINRGPRTRRNGVPRATIKG